MRNPALSILAIIFLFLTAGTVHAQSIEGSTISRLAPSEVCSPANYLFQFEVVNLSPDEEWLAHIEITFPEGFVIHPETAVYEEGFSGPWAFDFQVTGDGIQTAVWLDADGGEGEIWAGDSGIFQVEVSAPAGLEGALYAPWLLEGDDYAEPPHVVTGEMTIPLCVTATEATTWGAVKALYR
jgi:hypothetical protein